MEHLSFLPLWWWGRACAQLTARAVQRDLQLARRGLWQQATHAQQVWGPAGTAGLWSHAILCAGLLAANNAVMNMGAQISL